MSMYQLMNGVNPATFLLLPMLGRHADEYPRYRDCFPGERGFVLQEGLPVMATKLESRENVICVLTRTGGGNRAAYAREIEGLRMMPCYLDDSDDALDSTYALFVFVVPSCWLPDYHAIMRGNLTEVSSAYREQMKCVYPKLAEKFDTMFAEVGSK
jgi:hypothetical protein